MCSLLKSTRSRPTSSAIPSVRRARCPGFLLRCIGEPGLVRVLDALDLHIRVESGQHAGFSLDGWWVELAHMFLHEMAFAIEHESCR